MPPYRDKDGCVDYRRQTRTKQNVYECPPPPPEVLQCSICGTAECEGSNIWNSVPFVSYSTMFGPTLFDILIHVLNLLPLSVICWLGIGHHKKCCAVKPPVFNYDPLNETPKKKYQDHPKGEGSVCNLQFRREEQDSGFTSPKTMSSPREHCGLALPNWFRFMNLWSWCLDPMPLYCYQWRLRWHSRTWLGVLSHPCTCDIVIRATTRRSRYCIQQVLRGSNDHCRISKLVYGARPERSNSIPPVELWRFNDVTGARIGGVVDEAKRCPVDIVSSMEDITLLQLETDCRGGMAYASSKKSFSIHIQGFINKIMDMQNKEIIEEKIIDEMTIIKESNDSLSGWMHDEYLSLAKELADLRKLTCERRDEDDPDNRDLLQARNYVLDRLAEMLAKREEIERR
ncbi:hypothetical protein J6590_008053 [Homalodisca vitripennis]|nr:hypothetical protein J6590_008053 [Homalodisca vitripennis]